MIKLKLQNCKLPMLFLAFILFFVSDIRAQTKTEVKSQSAVFDPSKEFEVTFPKEAIPESRRVAEETRSEIHFIVQEVEVGAPNGVFDYICQRRAITKFGIEKTKGYWAEFVREGSVHISEPRTSNDDSFLPPGGKAFSLTLDKVPEEPKLSKGQKKTQEPKEQTLMKKQTGLSVNLLSIDAPATKRHYVKSVVCRFRQKKDDKETYAAKTEAKRLAFLAFKESRARELAAAGKTNPASNK